MKNMLRKNSELSPLLLRIALGAMFMAHAYLKYSVFTVAGFETYLAGTTLPFINITLPSELAWPIIIAEGLGGLLILIGLFSRTVTTLLLPILFGAILVHFPAGWSITNGGWEYSAFITLTSLAYIFGGSAGALAINDK